jgi:membrane-bound metal-dependent hydrolase YbcI (DUF457 family)
VNAKAGVVTSQVFWLGTAPLLMPDWRGVAGGFLLAGVASFGPDMDHSSSTIGRLLGPVPRLIRKVGGGHRGVTHSVAAVLAVFGVGLLYGAVPALAAAEGWLAHIWCDLLTIEGVQLFWPLTARPHLASMRTGKRGERAYTAVLSCFGAMLIIFYAYELVPVVAAHLSTLTLPFGGTS